MVSLHKMLTRLAIPDLPDGLREDFVIGAAEQVQKQAFWLFLALLCTTPFAVLVAHPDSSWLVHWGLPGAMALYCIYGLIKLSRDHRFADHPRRAARFVVESSVSSLIGALICTSWAGLSWLGADGPERLHFPVILVMGALATAYCLASVRIGAVIHLVIDIAPISLLLVTSGSTLDLAVGISMALAGLFQWRMINVHHHQVIELLRLKRYSQELAQTDPLTGLPNRRALLDFARGLGAAGSHARLLIVDVDRFKAVNDGHGHDVGDAVLREIARIIAAHGSNSVSVARLGGEEFALLGTPDALPSATALSLLAQVRDCAMPNGANVTISIGIAEGRLDDDTAWRELYRRADAALYEAKHSGRNRFCQAAPLVNPARAAAPQTRLETRVA